MVEWRFDSPDRLTRAFTKEQGTKSNRNWKRNIAELSNGGVKFFNKSIMESLGAINYREILLNWIPGFIEFIWWPHMVMTGSKVEMFQWGNVETNRNKPNEYWKEFNQHCALRFYLRIAWNVPVPGKVDKWPKISYWSVWMGIANWRRFF